MKVTMNTACAFIALALKSWLIRTLNRKQKHPEDSANAITQARAANTKPEGLQQKLRFTVHRGVHT